MGSTEYSMTLSKSLYAYQYGYLKKTKTRWYAEVQSDVRRYTHCDVTLSPIMTRTIALTSSAQKKYADVVTSHDVDIDTNELRKFSGILQASVVGDMESWEQSLYSHRNITGPGWW